MKELKKAQDDSKKKRELAKKDHDKVTAPNHKVKVHRRQAV